MALISTAKLFLFSSSSFSRTLHLQCLTSISAATPTAISYCSFTSTTNVKKKKTKQKKLEASSIALKAPESSIRSSSLALIKEKRRTRSNKEFDDVAIQRYGDTDTHIPVMLAEVLDVFSASNRPIRSFIDCTVGAAGHSAAIIRAHPEMKCYIGIDVDPTAHDKARARVDGILHEDSSRTNSDLNVYIFLKNYKYIKSLLSEVDEKLLHAGLDGILMDLGMSSMQVNNPERGFSVLGDGPLDMRMDPMASLKAEDILNSWPDAEVGRILREYGEESNWRSLRNKIVKARSNGGLHTTGDLLDLIRHSTPGIKGGRQGWIKTATRVFQALRIAVNDELKTLEDSLYACFDCLAPGGRLAVISFHSLEDRVAKRTFLDIISSNDGAYGDAGGDCKEQRNDIDEKEEWIRQTVQGSRGTILTKRPITPSEEEEKLNRRSRSAKLRVIQKGYR